ncbi:MAG: hypothetical protein V6Z86_03545, partial [Hyphomicrobiales bacterium]
FFPNPRKNAAKTSEKHQLIRIFDDRFASVAIENTRIAMVLVRNDHKRRLAVTRQRRRYHEDEDT